MSAPLQTIVVIPAYNEAHRLDPDAFVSFAASRPGVGFLFVDDGSTDETAAVLAALCARRPDQCRYVTMEANAGKAEAVRRGLLLAAQDGAEFIGFWDADLSTPLSHIPDFTAMLEEHPAVLLVTGARIRLLGRHITRKATRHYVGRVFATMASLALRLPIYDTQCGAKLFRADPRVVGIFAAPFRSRWIFDVEMIARLTVCGGVDGNSAVYELPLLTWEDVDGSRLRLKDFARAPLELAHIYWHYTRAGKGSGPQSHLPVPGPTSRSSVDSGAASRQPEWVD